MSNHTVAREPRVPPIKLLGARGALVSLGYGAILGPAVGLVVSALFLPAAETTELKTGLLIMSIFFGLFFGPMLTLGAASMLAVAGFCRLDFLSVGWKKLLLLGLIGLAGGILVGLPIGSICVKAIGAGDALLFMWAMIGGILGALVPSSVVVGRAAKRRSGKGA